MSIQPSNFSKYQFLPKFRSEWNELVYVDSHLCICYIQYVVHALQTLDWFTPLSCTLLTVLFPLLEHVET